jgi:hypothetical protein
MTSKRYSTYLSTLAELDAWRRSGLLDDEAYDSLRDAAEGLLLARGGDEAEEPLARASTTVLALLVSEELGEQNASWLLDSLLSCGPRVPLARQLSDAA